MCSFRKGSWTNVLLKRSASSRAGSLRQVLVVEARDHTKTLQERLLSFSPRQMALRRGAKIQAASSTVWCKLANQRQATQGRL